MAIKNIITFSVLIMTISFVSCSKDIDSTQVINLEKQYNIQLHQSLSNEGAIPSLLLSSVEFQECTNTTISFETNITNASAAINLLNVELDGECVVSTISVEEIIDLGNLVEEKEIVISLSDVIDNQGILTDENDQFSLVMESEDGIIISHNEINKIKNGMLWGFVSNIESDDFFDFLGSVEQSYTFDTGDYGHFYIDMDNEIHNDAISNHPNSTSFLISTNLPWEEMEERAQVFKSAHPNLTGRFYFHNGEELVF